MSIIKNKKILAVILVALLVIGGAAYFVFAQNNDRAADNIDYSPPTDEEKDATKRHKQSLAENDKDTQSNNDSGNTSGKKKVNPFISVAKQFNDNQYGNRVEVRAYIPEIVESGGKCKVSFIKGSQKVNWGVDALPDVSTTICDVIMVPRNKFPSAGQWSTIVKYESSMSAGTSKPVKVEVK